MKEKELRRSLAVFPIGSVMKLTDLTARQIRYYEEQGLLTPHRSDSNRRLYSLNDMDKLLEIKDFISEGLNISDIQQEYEKRQDFSHPSEKGLSDAEVRQALHDILLNQSRFEQPNSKFGNLRF